MKHSPSHHSPLSQPPVFCLRSDHFSLFVLAAHSGSLPNGLLLLVLIYPLKPSLDLLGHCPHLFSIVPNLTFYIVLNHQNYVNSVLCKDKFALYFLPYLVFCSSQCSWVVLFPAMFIAIITSLIIHTCGTILEILRTFSSSVVCVTICNYTSLRMSSLLNVSTGA